MAEKEGRREGEKLIVALRGRKDEGRTQRSEEKREAFQQS